MNIYPPRKFILTGDGGAGKTSLGATFPKPMRVWHFDNPDKAEWPYEQIGELGPLQSIKDSFVKYRWVIDESGKRIVRIDFFNEIDPRDPRAWIEFQNLHARAVRAGNKPEGFTWATMMYDSVTQMMLFARKDQQYRVNVGRPKEVNIEVTNEMEEFLQVTIPALPCNAIVCIHLDHRERDVSGQSLHIPVLPGRLRANLFTQYSELYRLYIVREEDGKRVRKVQTQEDDLFFAYTQIDAPDGCAPHYDNLWSNWAKKHAKQLGENGKVQTRRTQQESKEQAAEE